MSDIDRIRTILQPILESHFLAEALPISRRVDEQYERLYPDIRFAERSRNPMDRRLPMAAYLLALIIVLDERGVSYSDMEDFIVSLARKFAEPRTRWQARLKVLAPRLLSSSVGRFLLRRLDARVQRHGHPEGFDLRVLTDPGSTHGFGYGVDILACGICKLFAKHRYQRYTPILCKVDYLTSTMAGLQLIRSGTIATGADKCDFRYTRIT